MEHFNRDICSCRIFLWSLHWDSTDEEYFKELAKLIKEAKKGDMLANDVAQLVAPGNETAQKAATVIDLASDLAIGRISANAAESAIGKGFASPNGLQLVGAEIAGVKDAGELGGKVGQAFVLAAYTETGYNEVVAPLVGGEGEHK